MNQNKEYEITVRGCDDKTVVDMVLTKEELEIIKRFAKEVNSTSGYPCMPTIDIVLYNEDKEIIVDSHEKES